MRSRHCIANAAVALAAAALRDTEELERLQKNILWVHIPLRYEPRCKTLLRQLDRFENWAGSLSELGAGLNWSTSYRLFQNLARAVLFSGVLTTEMQQGWRSVASGVAERSGIKLQIEAEQLRETDRRDWSNGMEAAADAVPNRKARERPEVEAAGWDSWESWGARMCRCGERSMFSRPLRFGGTSCPYTVTNSLLSGNCRLSWFWNTICLALKRRKIRKCVVRHNFLSTFRLCAAIFTITHLQTFTSLAI